MQREILNYVLFLNIFGWMNKIRIDGPNKSEKISQMNSFRVEILQVGSLNHFQCSQKGNLQWRILLQIWSES